MRHFPIYMNLAGRRIVVSGAGATAEAKLRLLLKTQANICVFGAAPTSAVRDWARQGRIELAERMVNAADLAGAVLVYGATDDLEQDKHVAALARSAGALVNIVDNLDGGDFITPAIVDRDPVTVAIGTEGAAPVLARRIKADVEARLPSALGALAEAGRAFRPEAEELPPGRPRREFWNRYYEEIGPRVFASEGAEGLAAALADLRDHLVSERPDAGRVDFVSAGPGDPDLLTVKARRALHEADVVIYDRLVASPILELARREAIFIDVGKTPGAPSWPQDGINALMIEHAGKGHVVARLKSGDAGAFGRLDEETDALREAGIEFTVIPGVTSAAAAAAAMKASMTRRGRNSALQFITGHDMEGYAEQDWRALSRSGATAAIYMGVRAARFIQGRLLLHGADPETPLTVVENASRPDQKITPTTLGDLVDAMGRDGIRGPAILFLGLAPHRALGFPTAEAPATPGVLAATGVV